MNILALDDEIYALKLLSDAIEEAAPDAKVYLCQDVRSAFSVAKSVHIDVAFLDIHMPEKTGLELALDLKTVNPRINIIFATGFSEYMKEGLDLRMSGYILKPVTAEAVKVELENLRHPIEWKGGKKLRIVTFGNFEAYAGG